MLPSIADNRQELQEGILGISLDDRQVILIWMNQSSRIGEGAD